MCEKKVSAYGFVSAFFVFGVRDKNTNAVAAMYEGARVRGSVGTTDAMQGAV